jgi:hypothetical protein
VPAAAFLYLRMEGMAMWWSTFDIFLGTFLIGVGGLVLTRGWNMRSAIENQRSLTGTADQEHESQRALMLRTLTAEYLTNSRILDDPNYNERDEEKLKTFVVYPRLQSSGLTAALASGLFTKEADRELFTRIFDLASAVDGFNYKLILAQQQMATAPLATNISLWRKRVRDGQTLRQIRTRVVQLGFLLLRRYRIDPNEEFLAQLPLVPAEPTASSGLATPAVEPK